MSEQSVANPKLSPAARALLAQLENDPTTKDAAMSTLRASRPSDDIIPTMGDAPVLLAPQGDPKANAFAELLNHIEDSGGDMLVDEKAALAAAEKYRSEKQAGHIDFDDADTLADMAAEVPDPEPQAFDAPPEEEGDENEEAAALGDIAPMEEAGDMALADADIFDDGDFDDEFFDMEEEPTGFKGFLARLRGHAGDVKKLVGVKNAASAYDAQSGNSLLPFTIVRAVILLLVAAVPPAVNLIVIQPQISDNSRKLTQIRSFEAQAVESKKAADKLARKLAALEQDARRRIDILMPNTRLEELFNRYVGALQQYDIGLQRYNVSSLEERKVIVGSRVQEASLVELDLEGRYDVYIEIRKIFVEQLKNVVVLNEALVPLEDELGLQIKARMMVPTRRGFDPELDDPSKAKKKEEAE